MSTDVYTLEERELLRAWFDGKALTIEQEEWLEAQGFDHDPCEAYTRLDAWVGAFAVRDIQERLPNCGICRDDGVILTRPIVKNRRSKRVAGAVRFLFRINWADSGPGFSWPADYHLVWLPGFDRWVLTYSADSPDAMGYCDFALGAIGALDVWRASIREILIADWRFQYSEWEQTPWAYVWRPGLVCEEEAMAWRRLAWTGHEDIADDQDDEGVEGADDEDEEGERETEALELNVRQPRERRHTDVPAGPQRSRESGALRPTRGARKHGRDTKTSRMRRTGRRTKSRKTKQWRISHEEGRYRVPPAANAEVQESAAGAAGQPDLPAWVPGGRSSAWREIGVGRSASHLSSGAHWSLRLRTMTSLEVAPVQDLARQLAATLAQAWDVPADALEVKFVANPRLRRAVARFKRRERVIELGPRFFEQPARHEEIL